MLHEVELAKQQQEVLSVKAEKKVEVPILEGVDVGCDTRYGVLHVARARDGSSLASVGMVTDKEVGCDNRIRLCVQDFACHCVFGDAHQRLEGCILHILKLLVLLPCSEMETLVIAAALSLLHPKQQRKGRERDWQPGRL
eukprot:3937736-Rhodomonas_salina.1